MIDIERQCPITGKWNTLQVPLTQEEYDWGMICRKNGVLIQDAFPTINAGYREFIKTGITPQKWDELFGEE